MKIPHTMRWYSRRLKPFIFLFIIYILYLSILQYSELWSKNEKVLTKSYYIRNIKREEEDIQQRGGDSVDGKQQNESYHVNKSKEGTQRQGKHTDDFIYWSETSGLEKVFRNNRTVSALKLKQFKANLNIEASDRLPLNRKVPDSRPEGCNNLTYPKDLPTASIVIPFYNEWPSVLMRTVHSLVGRTPSHILRQIILVDDASDLDSLKTRLDNYVSWTFPEGLVKIVRLPTRQGLTLARLEGFKHVTSEAVSFFDSHMEVNKDWIQPLLYEIVKDPKTGAMAQLDYIHHESLEYNFQKGHRPRYGFTWDMTFFETNFRPDQLKGKTETDPLPGVLMVGAGYVIKSEYFKELGTYDSKMTIWGGENIEMAWRVWMCGGRLVHVPCSRIGHITRTQPYTFPQDRKLIEQHNYKRAAEVWMGPYKKYLHIALPGIKDLDAGNLDERMKLKEKLKCKDFKWFLENIWPELLPYMDVGSLWGVVKSSALGDVCLDNKNYRLVAPQPLGTFNCNHVMLPQGFALSQSGHLRTTLQCVVAGSRGTDLIPQIQNCMLDLSHRWKYDKQQLVHLKSNTCLQVVVPGNQLVLKPCQDNLKTQQWLFVRQQL